MPQVEPRNHLRGPEHSGPTEYSLFRLPPTPLRNQPRVSKPSRVQGFPDAPAQNRTKGPRTESATPRPPNPAGSSRPEPSSARPPPTGPSAAPPGEPSPARAPPDSTPSQGCCLRPAPASRAGPESHSGAAAGDRQGGPGAALTIARALRSGPALLPGPHYQFPAAHLGRRGCVPRRRAGSPRLSAAPAPSPRRRARRGANGGARGPGSSANHARGPPAPPAPAS